MYDIIIILILFGFIGFVVGTLVKGLVKVLLGVLGTIASIFKR